MTFDLSHITITQLVILTLVLTLIDFVGGVLPALIKGAFDPALGATFLDTHILKRVFPIVGLVLIAQTLGPTTDAGKLVWGMALVGVTTYLVETVASLSGNLPSAGAAKTDDSA